MTRELREKRESSGSSNSVGAQENIINTQHGFCGGNMDLDSGKSEFKSCLSFISKVILTFKTFLISLSLSLLLCKVEVVIISQAVVIQIMCVKCLLNVSYDY